MKSNPLDLESVEVIENEIIRALLDSTSVEAENKNYEDDDDPLAENDSFEIFESSMGKLNKYFMTDKFVDNTNDISVCATMAKILKL